MRVSSLLGLSQSLMVVSATKHYLFAGNLFNTSSIHSLVFDDQTDKISLVRTIPADNSSAWLAFDSRKQNLYSSSLNTTYISSYRINSPTNITFNGRIHSQGKCNGTTSAFIQGDNVAPYTVYSNSWPGKPACGMAIGVTPQGDLSNVIDTWAYANESGVHGIALHRRRDNGQLFVYSADLNGDSVWTHKVSNSTGKVSLVAQKKTARTEMHPRHIAVHPNSTFAYVVMEKANTVVAFDLDGVTGEAISAVKEYALIPEGENNENYWSAEVILSPSSRYLWATARAQRDTEYFGYISCFLLSPDGKIIKRMFMVPTTTRGGWANAVTPAFWSDEYVSLADIPTGYVEIWKMQGRKETPDGIEYETAKSLDKVIIKAEGCCANAIWYS